MFSDIDLYPGLRTALDRLGFDQPTDVQHQAVPMALAGHDLQVCARTGTGKTLAYLVPLVQRLCQEPMTERAGALALVLAPTRELARQVFKECEALSASTPLNVMLICGGESLRFQTAALRKNPEILVATPGRLLELMDRQAADLSALRMLVLDEADRVLEMGFGEDVTRIAVACPGERQTIMVSATLTGRGIGTLTRDLLRNPLLLDMTAEQRDPIEHCRLLSDDRHHRNQQLVWLLRHQPHERALVFANTRAATEQIFTLLRAQGMAAGVLHGDKDQQARKTTLTRFRQGAIEVLVASDVAARGIDIPEVELVINFDLPRKGDDYRHRVGRTGRAGRYGMAVSLVEPGQWNLMIDLQRYLKLQFTELQIEELPGKFRGPKKTRKSGKTVGTKKKGKKPVKAKTGSASVRKKTQGSPAPTGNETVRRKR